MRTNIAIILVAVIIFSIINFIIKIIGYSFKARKHGIKTKATFVGYYVYNNLQNIMWYPVVKFYNMNGVEIIARSKCLLALPVYKAGDKIDREYYAEDINTRISKEIYTNRFTTQKEEMTINSKVNYNILDIKHLLDSIIEIIFIVILLIITII